ncbi:hypothetical protein [Halomonas heilongjiangensis]|uniref:hypothetical protein n=1 Tax=Halomonas heilongjiangensis TaxID=1387883 RepID=UPI000D75D057|nr:hypothetical protein [Halomonas heilongjiangensis]PXX89406.1 hypothetical protein CR158_10670 [Halomonas heilongjiangensis]
MSIKTTMITATAALALSLSSAALADEVYSETATGMAEAAIQAICDGDKELHIAMHNRKELNLREYDDQFDAFHQACQDTGIARIDTKAYDSEAYMQQHKRHHPLSATITMKDGVQYKYVMGVVWGTYRSRHGSPSVEAWRISGFSAEAPKLSQ